MCRGKQTPTSAALLWACECLLSPLRCVLNNKRGKGHLMILERYGGILHRNTVRKQAACGLTDRWRGGSLRGSPFLLTKQKCYQIKFRSFLPFWWVWRRWKPSAWWWWLFSTIWSDLSSDRQASPSVEISVFLFNDLCPCLFWPGMSRSHQPWLVVLYPLHTLGW